MNLVELKFTYWHPLLELGKLKIYQTTPCLSPKVNIARNLDRAKCVSLSTQRVTRLTVGHFNQDTDSTTWNGYVWMYVYIYISMYVFMYRTVWVTLSYEIIENSLSVGIYDHTRKKKVALLIIN